MAYTPKARALRRCTHVYGPEHPRAGETCRAYSLWDDPHGRCAPHAGRTRGVHLDGPGYECATRPRCHCRAYGYPHRPGGGLCRWPDEPTHTDPTPPGLHTYGFRLRRPAGYVTTWATARRRSFDVTPPGVKRRSKGQDAARVNLARVYEAAMGGRPYSSLLDGLLADAKARGIVLPHEAAAPGIPSGEDPEA